MNLHPLTVVLLLVLAFFFYSQGQFFFFFSTLAIGFLLLVVSLSAGGAPEKKAESSSAYPEKMHITIGGPELPEEGGQTELGESFAGAIDFTGKLTGWLIGPWGKGEKKEEKK